MGMTGFDRVCYLLEISQRDNCKLRWIILNGNTKENAQVQANMNVVYNILNDESTTGSSISREVELAEVA